MKYLGRIFFPLHRLLVGLFLAIFLTACGSGGGGGGNNSSPSPSSGALPPVIYVGNESDAVVTGTNAKALAAVALADPVTRYGYRWILQDLLLSVVFNPPVSGSYTGVGTVNCVEGTAAINITVEETTGDFIGNIRYSACSYHNVGEFLSGYIPVTGRISGSAPNLRFDTVTSGGTLAFTQPSGSHTLTGALKTQYLYDPISLDLIGSLITANASIRNDNNVNGIEYLMLTNFEVYIAYGPSYDDLTFLGTVCHSVEGCMTVATPTAFRHNFLYYDLPTIGQLVITGADKAKVRLTALDYTGPIDPTDPSSPIGPIGPAYYDLEWDLDGDGVYDDSLLLQPW